MGDERGSTSSILLSPADVERFTQVGRGIRDRALKQCLPLGLVVAIIVGLALPVIGTGAAAPRIGNFGVVDTLCVWFIFLMSGMTLKTDEAVQALGAWRALLWAAFAILGATPLVAPLVMRIPRPFPAEFALGFAIFCTMPTTINTGVALTVQAKGSFALALVITVSSNLVAVFTVPFLLSAMLELQAVRIDPLKLLSKLLVLIFAPLVVGKATRELSASVRAFTASHKQAISLCSNFALILIPWMKLSESARALSHAGSPALLAVLALALAIHLAFLGFNWLGCKALRLREAELRCVVIMASQKTLPMAMAVLAALPPELGQPGLIAIPCIVAHITQIFVDAFVATRWANRPIAERAQLDAAKASLGAKRLHDSVELESAQEHDASEAAADAGGHGSVKSTTRGGLLHGGVQLSDRRSNEQ